MPLIELQNVTRIYIRGTQRVAAVDNLSLAVDAGEFTVLAGPSGSGKTTVLNLVGGLDRPTSGRIVLDGTEAGKGSMADLADLRLRRVGFIFQAYNLIPVLTAAENAGLTLELQGVPAPERRRRVQTLLNALGLAGKEGRRPADLSGGEQQRVAVARAIAAEPAIVLADEPTAHLDSTAAAELLDLMERLHREKGVTFLFSSHDPRVIARASRIIHLRDGRLERDAPSPL